MSYFLKSGNTFRVSSKEAMDLHDTLPAGNYVIKKDPFENLFLEQIENFEFKGKMYGDTSTNAVRILSTFQSREGATGVMLNGEKGSGKTLLAKTLSIEAAKQGIPTIVINAPWAGDKFNAFLQSIEQPCVILFDEFEKVYDNDSQEQMLTLLDGVFPSKKLFVLTCNDKWRVNTHMRNRPGRIFYMLDYKGLEADFIREYCADNLATHAEYTEKICNIASLFAQFNFDMLKALVEEMNRYNEAPEVALKMLNVKPEFDEGNSYKITLSVNGEELPENMLESKEWHGNPLQKPVNLEYKVIENAGSDDEDWDWHRSRFSHADLVKIDPNNGKFVFTDKEGSTLVLTRTKEKTYNYYNAF